MSSVISTLFLLSSLNLACYPSANTFCDVEERRSELLSAFVETRNRLEEDTSDEGDVTQFTPLYDFSGELTHFYIEINDDSYHIVDASDFTPIEFALDSVGPYDGNDDGICIYGGPLDYRYLDIKNNTCYEILEKESIQLEDSFNFQISQTADTFDYSGIYQTSTILSGSVTENLIDNSDIISNLTDLTRDDGSSYNNRGICGYVAAAIALYYSKYQFNDDLISDNHIENIDGQRRFKADLVDLLVEIGEQNDIGTSTTAFSIKTVMQAYTDSLGLDVGHYAMLLSTPLNIQSALDDNYPCVLFENFKNPYEENQFIGDNHAVTCYGKRSEIFNNGSSNSYFVVHYGFNSTEDQNYSKVYLLDSLTVNPIGSYYNMFFD